MNNVTTQKNDTNTTTNTNAPTASLTVYSLGKQGWLQYLKQVVLERFVPVQLKITTGKGTLKKKGIRCSDALAVIINEEISESQGCFSNEELTEVYIWVRSESQKGLPKMFV